MNELIRQYTLPIDTHFTSLNGNHTHDESDIFQNTNGHLPIEKDSILTSGAKKDRVEQMYWCYTRGLIITLPPDITSEIVGPICRGECLPPTQGHRLALIEGDSIMKKRYPNPSDGYQFMSRVDMEWRTKLLKEAQDIALAMKEPVMKITGCNEDNFAIILFGSISRGLCKNKNDEDPSNIDLSIMGNFSKAQKEAIFDIIRPFRDSTSQSIGNNVGVFVQNIGDLKKDGFSPVIHYIGGCSQPLYDPGNIWKALEKDALEFSLAKIKKTMYRKEPYENIFIRNWKRSKRSNIVQQA